MINMQEIEIAGLAIPVYSLNSVVVGSGAAGLACAERLVRELTEVGVENPLDEVALITEGLGLGTSNNSGSDKQTYYRLAPIGAEPDSPLDFAKTLSANGCMHGDQALVEGENSSRAFHHLADLGVPFPHTAYGGFVGFKTDHDPRQRGTSAGPWTSRFMVQKLLAECRRLKITMFNRHHILSIITIDEGNGRSACGMLCSNMSAQIQDNHGLVLFNCRNIVMAAGGPGDIYEFTVYPKGQMAPYAPMLEAGIEAVNLTESQYGMTSLDPRWCLSGTYQQVVPRYFSTNADGSDEQEFLMPWFHSIGAMRTATFSKGYQWPFDCDRIAEQSSSLLDLLVFRETVQKGRKVYIDFRRNSGGSDFRLQDLSSEAQAYLSKSGATQATPIERLAHMNQPSIDLYKQQGVDLANEPLQIGVCAQHCNGGFAVNLWWESSLRHLFVIGEFAGTHGIKRPGGSALNSGQVGALRAAQRIAHAYFEHDTSAEDFSRLATPAVRQMIEEITRIKSSSSGALDAALVKKSIQRRMSQYAAAVRRLPSIIEAINEAMVEYRNISEHGLKQETPGYMRAWETREMALAQLAFLNALRGLMERGEGSRGSHLVLDPAGVLLHPQLEDHWRALPENKSLREEVMSVRYNGTSFAVKTDPVRAIPSIDHFWFENTWGEFREAGIFRMSPQDRVLPNTIYLHRIHGSVTGSGAE